MCFRPTEISLDKTCPACGATNDVAAEVCASCGEKLPKAPPMGGAPGGPGAPGAPGGPGAPGAPKAPGGPKAPGAPKAP